jgi:hypothetical protein
MRRQPLLPHWLADVLALRPVLPPACRRPTDKGERRPSELEEGQQRASQSTRPGAALRGARTGTARVISTKVIATNGTLIANIGR